ncbi:MAG: DUF885 domain-containing protein [Elusimicrobiales bacterium]|nr:DUF885 domain-containing protein [Elusimicrobiales bacterium]
MKFFLVLILNISFFRLFCYEDTLTLEATKGKLEGARLQELIEKYAATIVMYDPERASLIGIHENDHILTSRDYANFNKYLEALKFMIKDLERIDYESLDIMKKSEYETLYSMIEKDIYEIENINKLSLYPQYYLEPFDIVYFMMNKEYMPYNLRAKSALMRLSKIPTILFQAERNITRPPKQWTLYSVKKASSVLENIGDYYPLFRNYIGLDPTLKEEFEKNISALKIALERYISFLQREVYPKSDGKPYVGLYTYGFYLERWHNIDYNPRKALRIAKKNFDKNYKKLVQIATKIAPDKYIKGGIGEVYTSITGDYPEYDYIIKHISDLFDKAKNHFDEYRVIRYPTQRLLIKTLPAFWKGFYPSVFYSYPYALDRERVGELYIYMPDEKNKEIQKLILLSLYSQPKIELFISTLLIPGLHVRYDYLSDVSKIRKIANQPTMDGWMDFAADMALEMGYYSSVYAPFMVQYFKTLRSMRAYLDVAFHIEELQWDDCISEMKKYFQFTDEIAQYEIQSISMNPTYSFASVYGYNEISKLRDKYVSTENRFFDLREFNSDILSRGNISFKNIKAEIKQIRKERLKEKIIKEEDDEE